MWSSIFKRVGRVMLSLAVAGAVQYATNSRAAGLLVPVLQGLGKWLRMRGFQNIPI